MMLIEVKYNIGQMVYLRTDIDQLKRICSGYTVRDGCILYIVNCGEVETHHFDFELSDAVDVLVGCN